MSVTAGSAGAESRSSQGALPFDPSPFLSGHSADDHAVESLPFASPQVIRETEDAVTRH
jgi:hypothetical protein